MTLTNCRATFGLQGKVTPTKAGSNGTLQVGGNNETISLTSATKIVSFDAVIVGAASDLVIDVSDLDNTGSTAWTPGNAQIETATAAGSITGSGNASVVVTASGMTGSPKTISVAVTNGDTASAWATKVRTALAADADVSSLFTVGGSTTAISLTRKATSSYTLNGTVISVYPANDATLNISLDNGTCTGITTAATSANTLSGIATAGSYSPDLDSTDFEGEALTGLSGVVACFIKNSSTSDAKALITQSTVLVDYPVAPGDSFQVGGASGAVPINDITIEPNSDGDASLFLTISLSGS